MSEEWVEGRALSHPLSCRKGPPSFLYLFKRWRNRPFIAAQFSLHWKRVNDDWRVCAAAW